MVQHTQNHTILVKKENTTTLSHKAKENSKCDMFYYTGVNVQSYSLLGLWTSLPLPSPVIVPFYAFIYAFSDVCMNCTVPKTQPYL